VLSAAQCGGVRFFGAVGCFCIMFSYVKFICLCDVLIANFLAELSRVQLFLQLSVVMSLLLLGCHCCYQYLHRLYLYMSCLVCFSLYIIQLCCSSLVLRICKLLVACLLVLR